MKTLFSGDAAFLFIEKCKSKKTLAKLFQEIQEKEFPEKQIFLDFIFKKIISL